MNSSFSTRSQDSLSIQINITFSVQKNTSLQTVNVYRRYRRFWALVIEPCREFLSFKITHPYLMRYI